MKFSTTFLALFAVVAACTMLDQADARVGGDRDLNSNEKYTIYFANSCKTDVKVQINSGHRLDREQTILADSCQVFQQGRQYVGPMITYTELDIDGATQVVSCESSNTNPCNLYGMPKNACVIKVDTCPKKPVRTPAPTRSPTRAPTRAPSPGKQCGRRCETTYDCSSNAGVWDTGHAWCGSGCTDGRCHPTYEDCTSDSDCDQNKSICGKQGYCVGK